MTNRPLAVKLEYVGTEWEMVERGRVLRAREKARFKKTGITPDLNNSET